MLTEQLAVSTRQKGAFYVLSCKSEIPPWYGILDIGLLHTQQNKTSPQLATFPAHCWFGFIVWLPGGCMNLEDVPSSASASHSITGLQQIVGVAVDQTLTSFCLCSLLSPSCSIPQALGPSILALRECFFAVLHPGPRLAGHRQWGWACSCAPAHQGVWGDPHLKAGRARTPGFSAVGFPRAQHPQGNLQPGSCCQLLLWTSPHSLSLPFSQLLHPGLRNADQPVGSENLATLCKSELSNNQIYSPVTRFARGTRSISGNAAWISWETLGVKFDNSRKAHLSQ